MFTTSASLLQRLRDPNDAAAWPRFIDYYTPLLLAWAQRLPMPGAEADDLVQDVFIKLIPVLRTFEYDPAKSFRGYLRTTCANCWRDHLRKRGNQMAQAADDQLARQQAPEPEPFWDRDYHRLLVQLALRFLAEKADAKTQHIIREIVMGGRRVKDVAPELQLSEGAASTRLYRILRELRQALNGLME